ncbi:MAG: MlaD family protein [Lactobacillus sp.]|jgi:paraquat-inducible protein B|nr:MlaD family protein [Lactobacillus sp.]
MAKTPNKKMIGLFTLTGLSLFVAMLLLLLGDKLFVNEDDLVVFYFEESIKGLSVGSPVVLQGVEIGKVMKIDIIADDEDLSFLIPVYVRFNSTRIMEEDHIEKSKDYWMDKLVKKGLRARLVTQNLLTGQLMIELLFAPETQVTYKGRGLHIEIPTTLSSLGELSNALQDLPIRQSIEKFGSLMDETTSLVQGLNRSIATSKINTADTISNFNKTMRDIGDAAQALRNFADYIERHPEALLKGKGKY